MKKIFIGKKGKSIIIPFVKNEKLKTFGQISNSDRNVINTTIKEVIAEGKLSSRRKKLQNLTDYLYDSTDPASSFFITQINLVLSSPELVRNELMDDGGFIKSEVKEEEDESLLKLQKYYLLSDLPAVFSVIANLYYYYLCQLEKGVPVYIDSEDFIDSIKSSGEMLKGENYNILQMFKLFKQYCNKPLANLPIETFSINFVYQLFYEFSYEQREHLTKSEFEKFCFEYGKNLIYLSKALEKRNYYSTYNVLFNISEIINNYILFEKSS